MNSFLIRLYFVWLLPEKKIVFKSRRFDEHGVGHPHPHRRQHVRLGGHGGRRERRTPSNQNRQKETKRHSGRREKDLPVGVGGRDGVREDVHEVRQPQAARQRGPQGSQAVLLQPLRKELRPPGLPPQVLLNGLTE